VSQLSKFLYLCAIVLLAWLAAKPHWPTIKEEAKNFYTAWQQIRSSDEGLYPGQPTEDLEKPIPRERAITAPTPAAELPAQVTKEGDQRSARTRPRRPGSRHAVATGAEHWRRALAGHA